MAEAKATSGFMGWLYCWAGGLWYLNIEKPCTEEQKAIVEQTSYVRLLENAAIYILLP